MSRFYLVQSGDNFSIYHRLTHYFLASSSAKNLRNTINEWQSFSEKELWTYLIEHKAFIPFGGQNPSLTSVKSYIEKEEWYTKAWKTSTEKIAAKYKFNLSTEDSLPYDLIDEIKKELNNKKDWSMEKKKAPKTIKLKIKSGTLKAA